MHAAAVLVLQACLFRQRMLFGAGLCFWRCVRSRTSALHRHVLRNPPAFSNYLDDALSASFMLAAYSHISFAWNISESANVHQQGLLDLASTACLEAAGCCATQFQLLAGNQDDDLDCCRNEVAEQLYMLVGIRTFIWLYL